MLKQYDQITKTGPAQHETGGVSLDCRGGVSLLRRSGVSLNCSGGVSLTGISIPINYGGIFSMNIMVQ